ncbi:MAG: ChbG/HpnK family deacetylase [Deltaproteobacteria bacterium]|nr:ChbG/HpnK family deacetylase [Deltaproteobacteria bacterium]
MDGHQHVHVFPAVISVAVRLAERHGIRWMRLPDEPAPPSAGRLKNDNGVLFAEAEMFSGLAAQARVHLDKARVKKTDAFRGLYLKGRLSVEFLGEVLENLPGGLTELMVHPGRAASGDEGPFSYFSTAERLSELRALMDERFRSALARCGVSLVSFLEV